jgi:hypothetical protein
MPTKILVVETPLFQLGANAGEGAERISAEGFTARIAQHVNSGGTDTLFVLAPSEVRHQSAFAEATTGDSSVSIGYFSGVNDAIRFLPSLLLFAGGDRAQGVKCYLKKESTIYSEALFSAKSVGSKLDPSFVFARSRLSADISANAWGCLQALVFLGLQNLPELGEKSTGEKIDIQLGADDKFVAFTVRFAATQERLVALRGNAILTLPRFAAGVFETRYVESAEQIEFTCLFYRQPGLERTIEIVTYNRRAELENAEAVKGFRYKSFGNLEEDAPVSAKNAVGGFKKKFSEQVKVVGESSPANELILVKGSAGEAEGSTRVKGSAAIADGITTVSGDAPAPYASPTVIVSGDASLAPERETIFKNENAANRVIELESKLIALEGSLKVAQEVIAKNGKEDPLAKRDVLTNIKDGQTEGLKQNIKLLEAELAESKGREKELMTMVDKAVQMKEDASKKIKELDMKLKTASNGGGSKVQMLEKAIDEQKRQNKELMKRVGELNDKLKAA